MNSTNLYILKDTLFSGYFPAVLDILSFTSILFAVLVITVKNPIVSVLYLIGLFFAIACYLISIGMSFIGLSYLLVYVGAVSILFLFILMLINIRVSELASDTKNSIPLVFLVTAIFANAGHTVFPLVNQVNGNLNYITSSN
jgi:NADH-ubiquinone oxidoreductase chain 6